jgi:hypothetical protein
MIIYIGVTIPLPSSGLIVQSPHRSPHYNLHKKAFPTCHQPLHARKACSISSPSSALFWSLLLFPLIHTFLSLYFRPRSTYQLCVSWFVR